MKKRIWYQKFSMLCISLVLFLIYPQKVYSSLSPLVINELYPQPDSQETEWVEVYLSAQNFTEYVGWTIWDTLSQPSLLYTFNGTEFTSSRFFTFPISSKLNNGGDTVLIKDANAAVVDSFSYVSSALSQSWSRTPDASDTFALTPPTFGSANPLPTPLPTVTPTLTPTATPQLTIAPTPAPTLAAPINALQLSELFPCPTGATEWIELINTAELPISADQITLRDTAGTIAEFSQFVLGAGDYYSVPISGKLNNSGDSVYLYVSEQLVDAVAYTGCTSNQSYNTDGNAWYWSNVVTQAQKNTPAPLAIAPAATEPSTASAATTAEFLPKANAMYAPSGPNMPSSTRVTDIDYSKLALPQLHNATLTPSKTATNTPSTMQPAPQATWPFYRQPVLNAIINGTVAIISSGFLLTIKT